MKSLQVFALCALASSYTFAQPSNSAFVASLSAVDRLAVVKNSVELSEWHEKSFWAQYNTYLSSMQEVAFPTYLSMEELAGVSKAADSTESGRKAQRTLDLRREELTLTRQYYVEIGREHNGVIALQFLQTESQLDMMESLNVYEHTYLRKFRLNPGFAATAKLVATKYNTISKALDLTPAEAQVFYPIYTRYQAESDDILGSDYSMYELFAGEASDYSSGLAKRIGYDLLTVMQRELELKQKYYEEVKRNAGPTVAARFLAWEDYYSVICKMTIWVEN